MDSASSNQQSTNCEQFLFQAVEARSVFSPRSLLHRSQVAARIFGRMTKEREIESNSARKVAHNILSLIFRRLIC
jgi:hypothetical protein